MKSKILKALLSIAAAVFMPISLFALTVSDSVTPTPGVWNSNFQSSLAYAEKNNLPIVVAWGSTACSHCNTLSDLIGTDDFEEWSREHPVILVLKHGSSSALRKDEDFIAAKAWIKEADSSLSYYPFMRISRIKNGVESGAAFTARPNEMPSKTPSGKTDAAFLGQLISTLDMYLGDYTPSQSGGSSGPSIDDSDIGDDEWTVATFPISGVKTDRFEAEPSTTEIVVPLERSSSYSKDEGSVVLQIYEPSSTKKIYSSKVVDWNVGEEKQFVRISVPSAKPGNTAIVRIEGANERTLDSTELFYVKEPENSPSNPHWIGDFTYSKLPYGEWTMDFDAAKAKVKAQGGYILAMFAGPLWCPNCQNFDNDILSTTKFKQWAKKSKVVPVLFDQGIMGNPYTAAGTDNGRLLSFEIGRGASGASYLTRNGIDPLDDVTLDVINQVTKLTSDWLTPLATSPRLGNPTLLLLNSIGSKPVARLSIMSADGTYDLNENMFRLEELLEIDYNDESSDYIQTTERRLWCDVPVTAEFQVSNASEAFILEEIEESCYLSIVLGGRPEDKTIKIELYNEKGEVVKEANNTMVVPVEKGSYYVRLTAYADASSVAYENRKGSMFEISVTAKIGDQSLASTIPFDEVSKSEAISLNSNLYASKKFTVPIMNCRAGSTNVLVGTATVSLNARNRISARVVTIDGTKSLSGEWETINLMTGNVEATLQKKDTQITLRLGGDGLMYAMVADPKLLATVEGTASGIAMPELKSSEAAKAYKNVEGLYTVTLPTVDSSGGAASLSVTIRKTGTASVSVILPEGKVFSVSSKLYTYGNGKFSLPVFKKTSSYVFSTVLSISSSAATSWGKAGEMDTIYAEGGIYTWYVERKKTNILLEQYFNTYGGYFKKNVTPINICYDFDLNTSPIELYCGGEKVADLEAEKSKFTFARGGSLTSFSYVKTKGQFTARVKVEVNGKHVTGTIKGVLLPGWIDCGCTGEEVFERPFGLGTLYYKSGKEVVTEEVELRATLSEY